MLRNQILKLRERCNASVGSADVVPDTAEKRDQAVSRPLMPTAHAERAHETGVGHPRRNGEVQDVQRTAKAMAEDGCSSSRVGSWSFSARGLIHAQPQGIHSGLLSAIKPNGPRVKCGQLTLTRSCAAALRSSPVDVQQLPSCSGQQRHELKWFCARVNQEIPDITL